MSHINFWPTREPAPTATTPLATLDARRSVPPKHLGEPGPDEATLLRLLQSAVRVPDHGKRVPCRFLCFRGDARHAFGERLAARRRQRDPDASEAVIEKDRSRFSHAPLIVAVIAKLGPDEKIPESERFSAASCACFALLQAAQALGFARHLADRLAGLRRRGRDAGWAWASTSASSASSTSARPSSTCPSASAPTRATCSAHGRRMTLTAP